MRSRFVILIVLMLSLLFLASCKKKEVKTPAEKAVNVRVQAVEEKALRPFVETIGTLNPNEEVIVSAEVDGILKNVNVDNGTAVSKGMLLAVIDDTDYGFEVKRAEAALRQAQATFENTKLEFGRKQSLYKEQLVTQQQFDDVSTRLSLAEADVERAKAALSLAKQKLIKTKVYSPLSGYIKEKKVSAGDYVRNGTNMFVIVQNNPLKLNFTVTERDVGRLKKGQDVTFTVDAFPGREFKGKVNIIHPNLEEKTRTLQVEALVPNADAALKPGLFAHVILYTGAEKNTILVPVTSLLYEGETIKVFVVEGDRVKERIVKTGQKYGEMMEIIEGVKKEELVVVAGQQNLSEGVKVNVAR
ncbi:MAG: efflux RND transporter periplasmic adaptor subunit [Thermodesulfovibrionales bacterium]|nr:efflux RND transporter periplasmic adaptor subunit [Thermodesulfovibrionales bacterium]